MHTKTQALFADDSTPYCKRLQHIIILQHINTLLQHTDTAQFRKDGVGADETGHCDAGHFDSMRVSYVSENPEVRKQYYMPALDEGLAKRFGHDGLGLQFDPHYTHRTDCLQSVQIGPDQLLMFVEGFSEAAVIKGKAQGKSADGLGHDDAPSMPQTIQVLAALAIS